MTAIGDKLKQADPMRALGAEFYAKATEMLRLRGSVREAWRGMESLGLIQLTRISTEMKGKKELGDHAARDTHQPAVPQAGGGQLKADTQLPHAAARSTSQSKLPKPFFQQKGADEKTKRITRQAALAGSSIWRDLKMERLRVHELDGFIRDQVLAGGNHALKAHWETKRAAVAWQIKQHASFTDENAFVKDCVSDKAMVKYVANADRQASLIVAKIVQQTAQEIDRGVKLIAAE